MGFFDKAIKAAQSIGNSASQSVTNASSTIGVAAQNSNELTALKRQINVIDQELDAAYSQIGKKYCDYVAATGDMGNIDVSNLLAMMNPKLQRKAELEAQVIEIEKQMKSNTVLRDKMRFELEFEDEKSKLDRALAMDFISKEEYDSKVSMARKRADNFEEIRKIENQFEMGIISKEEKNAKIESLVK